MIYQRTLSGSNILKHPDNGLATEVAVILMQIDGRTDLAKIAQRNARLDLPGIVRELALAGLVEEVMPAPAVSAPAAEPESSPAQATRSDFIQLGRKAAQIVTHALGPQADALALALEKAKSPALLAYQLELARDRLKEFRKVNALEELDQLVGEALQTA
jgi:hypothetical protein